MTNNSFLRLLAAVGLAALLAACATTEPATAELPIAPIGSVQEADLRLQQVAAENAAIEARYAEREAVCYDKFFVNHCLDQAKERRRAALAAQRAIEVDAERYKRRVKVEERDREIAKAEAEYQAEEARLAAEPPPEPRATPDLPPPRPRGGASQAAREQQRAREAGQEKLSAQERAANVRAFEERKRKSEERQKDVARRMAEREAKAARKAAEEAKKNATPPPAQ
jgi:hypothetical protein